MLLCCHWKSLVTWVCQCLWLPWVWSSSHLLLSSMYFYTPSSLACTDLNPSFPNSMSRSLHTMRNYIHINLCINLGIAQIIFVAGVDQSASDHVPIHCQAIAVFLHYFFLVSFMWMLMEGVVLYVVLVCVFVKNKKHYLLAFTIASYCIPLLYLGLLTLPLGFAIPTQPNYGYNTA